MQGDARRVLRVDGGDDEVRVGPARLVEHGGHEEPSESAALEVRAEIDGVGARRAVREARRVEGEVREPRDLTLGVRDEHRFALALVGVEPREARRRRPRLDVPGGDAFEDLAVEDGVDRGQIGLSGRADADLGGRHARECDTGRLARILAT